MKFNFLRFSDVTLSKILGGTGCYVIWDSQAKARVTYTFGSSTLMRNIFALLCLLLPTACNSISDAELGGLERTLKNSITTNGAFKFEAKEISSGKIGNKDFKLVRVSYTAPVPHPRQCAYVLYHHDTEAGLLTNQIIGLSNMMNGTCSVRDGCFGCNGKTFEEVVRVKGYLADIND